MIRLLLAGHDQDVWTFLTARLRKRGYEVLVARDGEAAVTTARSAKPDVILLALDMPVLDSWSVAVHLRADALTRETPIIAIATFFDPADRERAIKAGCSDHYPQPIDFLRLVASIETRARSKDERPMSGEASRAI